MSVWDDYNARLGARGNTKREATLNREREYLTRKVGSSLSYKTVRIAGKDQSLAVINSDNFDLKTLCSMPGEGITSGSLVEWGGGFWLVTAVDPNNEVYTKAIMSRCNHMLKWIDKKHEIHQRWCIVSDGTRYLAGETMSSYNENGMSLGDTRAVLQLPRDKDTVQLDRGVRLLIDDEESESVLAYRITKPFKLGSIYNGHGVMSFILSEVNTEDTDNIELRLADYYKHFPPAEPQPDLEPVVPADPDHSGKKVWI